MQCVWSSLAYSLLLWKHSIVQGMNWLCSVGMLWNSCLAASRLYFILQCLKMTSDPKNKTAWWTIVTVSNTSNFSRAFRTCECSFLVDENWYLGPVRFCNIIIRRFCELSNILSFSFALKNSALFVSLAIRSASSALSELRCRR